MGHSFGNNREDGYTPKSYEYKPKWERFEDRNPDHHPSTSGMFIEERAKDIMWLLPVAGLGVLVMRAEYEMAGDTMSMVFKGVSEFSDQEIGWRK
jgi:hypothetical protein